MYNMREEGKEEGITTGKKQKQIEIAKKLLKKNMDIKEIQEITELSPEEIEQINLE